MKIHRVLLFCFLSALCGGNTRCVSAEMNPVIGTEGRSITVICHFPFSGSRKAFCKEECRGTNILIETTEDKAQNNKYTIEYKGSFISSGVLYVTITHLKKSDSGRYRCHLSNLLSDLNEDVELVVKDAAITSSTHSTPTTFLETTKQPAGFSLPLVTCVPVIVLLLAVFLLVLYKLRSKRNFDGLSTGGNSNNRNVKVSPYEVYIPPSTCQESTYQNLDSASREPDQIYSTI